MNMIQGISGGQIGLSSNKIFGLDVTSLRPPHEHEDHNPLAHEMMALLSEFASAEGEAGLDLGGISKLKGKMRGVEDLLRSGKMDAIADKLKASSDGEFETMDALLGTSTASKGMPDEATEKLIQKVMNMISDGSGIDSMEELAKLLGILSMIFLNISAEMMDQISGEIAEFTEKAVQAVSDPSEKQDLIGTIGRMIEQSGAPVDTAGIQAVGTDVALEIVETTTEATMGAGEESFTETKEGVSAFAPLATDHLSPHTEELEHAPVHEVNLTHMAHAAVLSYESHKSGDAGSSAKAESNAYWVDAVGKPGQSWLSDAKQREVRELVEAFFQQIYPALQDVALKLTEESMNDIPDIDLGDGASLGAALS